MKLVSHKKRSSAGFTLIELLVVIAIIGLLASVVLASLNSAREKARNARRASDMQQTALALELYYDENRDYPSTGSSPYPIPNDLVTSGFLPTIPEDPNQTGSRDYRYYKGSGGQCQGSSPCYVLVVFPEGSSTVGSSGGCSFTGGRTTFVDSGLFPECDF